MQQITWFKDPRAIDPIISGGKGANLARLTQAGFRVPGGFILEASSYDSFLDSTGLREALGTEIKQLNYADATRLETSCSRIRQLIESTPITEALANDISNAYEKLGAEVFVAVRSSGTAEDLADDSFAGLHDTYLHIRGNEELVDAVRRCWASLWTTRAVSYRHTRGYDHFEAPIAVVVQHMVDPLVAGVLFTANPVTAATDEYVANASWGLGEAVVLGEVNPDEFIIDARTLRPREKNPGTKAREYIRNPETGIGTIVVDTSPEKQQSFCLDDEQLRELGDLGRRVMEYYDGLPQDLEWALGHDGKIYLLQSRPVTGTEFFWGEALELDPDISHNPDIVWTRAWSKDTWNGAITPLMYTWRTENFSLGAYRSAQLCGVDQIVDASGKRREPVFKFYRSEAYYNTRIEKFMVENTTLPAFRDQPHVLAYVPRHMHEDIMAAPLSLSDVIDMHLRIIGQDERAAHPFKYFDVFDEWFTRRVRDGAGLSPEELKRLSDQELKTYIDYHIQDEVDYTEELWFGFYVYSREAFCLLGWMLGQWYEGDAAGAMGDLLTGTPERTPTAEENIKLWRLADVIRSSEALTALFNESDETSFFNALETSDEGTDFLSKYREFAAEYPFRGHEDRDLCYDRREENWGIDYPAFKVLLSTDPGLDPEDKERQVNERRDATIEAIAKQLESQEFGSLKAELFKTLVNWILRFLVFRDNLRYASDISVYAAKKGFLEMGSRLVARGLVKEKDDFYFLGRDELLELFEGRANTTLAQAKIAGRKRDFLRYRSGEAFLPDFLQNNNGADFSVDLSTSEDGIFRGSGTSRGIYTGRAKVIRNIGDIGRVEQDDILVTHSTDPGWTSVFLVIGGIVLETGGMLAHGSSLAREYGLPAVQLENAMDLIPDGAIINVDGNTGAISIAS